MKIGKENVEGDKVLRFAIVAVIILFLIGALIIGTRMMNPRVDASEGKKKLASLEEVNVQTIDSQIQEMEQAESDAKKAWKSKSVGERMEGCLVLGDATVLKFQQNDVLSKSRVVTSETVVLSNGEETGLSDLISTTVEAAPKRLFLQFGRADAELGSVSADTFAAAYQTLIENLKGQLPDTTIYVCSVPGVRGISGAADDAGEAETGTDGEKDADNATADNKKAADSKSATDSTTADTSADGEDAQDTVQVVDLTKYHIITEYNTALKALCKSEHIKYIDNTALTKNDYFGDDGVTLRKAYLEACINNMLEVAFRRNVNE